MEYEEALATVLTLSEDLHQNNLSAEMHTKLLLASHQANQEVPLGHPSLDTSISVAGYEVPDHPRALTIFAAQMGMG